MLKPAPLKSGRSYKESFMKTNFVRQCGLGLAAGLIFFVGCARPSAEPEQPKAVSAPTTPILPAVAQAVPVAPPVTNVAPALGVHDTNAPAIVERIPASPQPENIQITPGLSEVVKLAQAGVGEEVILAYVEKYSGRFDVGAEQILYLNDLGVAGTVITSMLKHDGNPNPGLAVAPSVIQTQAVSNVPQSPVTAQGPPPTVSTSVPPPPSSAEVSYFYDTLSPYGSWIYLSGYGWCWQPTVAVSVSTWRPYCDRGRWYWSDAGWYWSSDYSWGWAAFHYGRWYSHPSCGWVWTPGVVWAPSWVSWRYNAGYCGWAPLPPEAHFVSGVGFTYYGNHVAVGFDFGLSYYNYAFVSVNNFCDYAPYRYVVPYNQVQNFYRNTTVINNYASHNGYVVNHGFGRDTVAQASQTRVREVSIRETPVSNMANVHGDRIEKQGNQTVVYRPQLPKTPPTVRSAQFTTRAGGASQTAATVGRTPNVGTGYMAPAGPSHGGSSRGQTSVSGSTGNANEDRNRTTVTPRGTQQQSPSTTPAPSQRQQPRANGPLFGSGTATTAQPQNNVAGRVAEPRTQTQREVQPSNVQPQPRQAPTQPNYSRPTPVYPQTQTQTQAQQPAARVERHNNGLTMPPRQQEQQPHYSSPAHSAPAPTVPQQSSPSIERRASPQAESARPAPVGGGGNRAVATPSRVERTR
jgi:hypothetical protein